MNFIGHALLASSGNDDFLYGNLVADGIKGNQLDYLGKDIEQGVRWHRCVDATVDQHPEIMALLKQMPYRRVAGIALDLIWDHFLSRDELTPELATRCYQLLSARPLPGRMKSMLEHLVRGRWLERYADYSFTLGCVEGVGHRLSGQNLLAELVPWLEAHYPLLEATYQRLWPDLKRELSAK